MLTYVTEAPAWKPSYRVVVGDNGKVHARGLGDRRQHVAARTGRACSSASARARRCRSSYDLWSVRQVQRETLAGRGALRGRAADRACRRTAAPKPGDVGGEAVIAELGDDEIRRPRATPRTRPRSASPSKRRRRRRAGDDRQRHRQRLGLGREGGTADARRRDDERSGRGRQRRRRRRLAAASTTHARKHAVAEAKTARARRPTPPPAADTRVASGDAKMKQLTQQLVHSNKTIVIEGYADANRADGERRANDRANIVTNQLIDQGVAPARIKIVTKVEPNAAERVRLVAQAAEPRRGSSRRRPRRPIDVDAQPVGESHFANPTPMTVERGSSAMVSMVRQRDRGRGRLPLRRRERARQRSLRVPRGAVQEPDRLDARDRPGHRVRQRAVHRRGPHRADPAEGVRGRAVRARSPDRRSSATTARTTSCRASSRSSAASSPPRSSTSAAAS